MEFGCAFKFHPIGHTAQCSSMVIERYHPYTKFLHRISLRQFLDCHCNTTFKKFSSYLTTLRMCSTFTLLAKKNPVSSILCTSFFRWATVNLPQNIECWIIMSIHSNNVSDQVQHMAPMTHTCKTAFCRSHAGRFH